jgi:hypothetical protein
MKTVLLPIDVHPAQGLELELQLELLDDWILLLSLIVCVWKIVCGP